MAEPARQFDEDEQLTAQERANQAWGITEPTDSAQESGYKSPLEQATESWGSAAVIKNDDEQREALDNSESSGGNQSKGSTANAQEQAEVGQASGIGINLMNYSGAGDPEGQATAKSAGVKLVNFLTKRSSVAGLVGGGAVGGLLVAGFMAAQPFQVVHFAQVLNQFHFFSQEDNGDSRTGRILQYLRKNPNKGNLGVLGNKIADKYQAKLDSTGVEFDFTNPNNGNQMATVQSMKVDLDNPKSQKVIDDLKSRGVEVGADGRVSLRGDGSSKAARQAIRSTVREAGYGKISGSMRSRILIKRAGVNFAPFKNLTREKGESLADYYKRKRDDRAKEVKNGAQSPGARTTGEGDVDEDGEPISDPEDDALSNETNESISNAEADLDAETSRLRGKVAKGVGAVSGLVALACVAREVNNKAGELQYLNVVLPLMRFGWEFKSAASQIMFGQNLQNGKPSMNIEEIGEMTNRLSEVVKLVELDSEGNAVVDDDGQPIETGETRVETWPQAESIRAEQGETGGIPAEEVIKPGQDTQSLPFTAWIDGIPGIGAACSTAGGFVLSALEIAGGIATGGGATVITQAIKSAILGGALSAAGIDPMGKFIEMIARKVVGAEIDPNKRGANAGNMANYAERLAANNVAIGSGGTELDDGEVSELDAEKNIAIRVDLKNKSFFARMFDLKEPNSVASVALLDSGNFLSKDTTLAWVKRLPLESLNAPTRNISQALTQKAYASSSYDYGFSEYGFSQAELDSEDYEDPYANGLIVEANLHGKGGKWDERYKDCFGVSVNEDGSLNIEDKSYYEIPDLCAQKADKELTEESKELTRYRFYLLDTLTTKSFACYEGVDDAACGELGFGGAAPTAETPGETTKPIAGDTFNTPCAEGTTDLSGDTPEIGYQDEKPYNIRICAVPGIKSTDGKLLAKVNSVSSKNFYDLSVAATNAGHPLVFNGAYSTFRTMEQQQFLCDDNPTSCAQGFTAKPGTSNHQMGFAIDFNLDGYDTGSDKMDGRCKIAKDAGVRCELPESATWMWLKDNAATYGVSQLEFEYWHWGTNE